MAIKTIPAEIRAARPTYASLATALSMAIQYGDAHLAVQLAWRLILQPDCPLRMQAHAVLMHSALALRLGACPRLVESNLRSTIHRIAGGAELRRLAQRGHVAPWRLEALTHLHSALRSLRVRGDIPFRVRYVMMNGVGGGGGSRRSSNGVVGRLVEGMRKMDLELESACGDEPPSDPAPMKVDSEE